MGACCSSFRSLLHGLTEQMTHEGIVMPFVLFPHGADHFLQFRILHLTFVGAHFLDGQFFLRELILQSVELAIGKRLE